MSDAGEIQTPNDYVVITVDVDDCPLVEFPLSELYDIATSLVVEDYLNVLRDYVTQVLDDTTWLDKPCKMGLLRTDFGVFDRRDDGGIFSLRKPALERLVAQILRSRSLSHHPIAVPVFVRFLCPEIDLPRNPSSTLDIHFGHKANIQQRPRAETMRPLFVDTTVNFLVPAAVLCPTFLVLDDPASRVTAVHNGRELPSAQSSISGMALTGVPMLLRPILQECAASTLASRQASKRLPRHMALDPRPVLLARTSTMTTSRILTGPPIVSPPRLLPMCLPFVALTVAPIFKLILLWVTSSAIPQIPTLLIMLQNSHVRLMGLLHLRASTECPSLVSSCGITQSIAVEVTSRTLTSQHSTGNHPPL